MEEGLEMKSWAQGEGRGNGGGGGGGSWLPSANLLCWISPLDRTFLSRCFCCCC